VSDDNYGILFLKCISYSILGSQTQPAKKPEKEAKKKEEKPKAVVKKEPEEPVEEMDAAEAALAAEPKAKDPLDALPKG